MNTHRARSIGGGEVINLVIVREIFLHDSIYKLDVKDILMKR